jgi:uncharacterized RDD family membrane protein YckC
LSRGENRSEGEGFYEAPNLLVIKKGELLEKTNPNKRVCAFLIDYVLLIIAELLIYHWLKIDPTSSIILFINFILLISRDSYKGISPGKYVVGIQVVDLNNIPISFLGSIKRNIILFWAFIFEIFLVAQNTFLIMSLISTIIVFIEYIRIAYTKSGRRIGDLIGKSKVIDLKPTKPGWPYFLLSVLIIIVSVVIFDAIGEFDKGNVFADSGQFEQAIKEFDKSNALADSGEFEQAIESYDKALQFKPDFQMAWNNRGVALLNLGRFEEALESVDNALQFKPDLHEAWNNRGIALAQLGRFEEALESIDNALQFKPDFEQAIKIRALLLDELKKP